MILKIGLAFLLLVVVVLAFLLFMMITPVCGGGELVHTDCGKILFPWVKKFKLPSGKYCCLNCYKNDLMLFVEMRKNAEKEDGSDGTDDKSDIGQ